MKDLLKQLVEKSPHFVEARFHKRITNSFMVQKGRVDVSAHSLVSGVGIRVFVDGAWGFAATTDISPKGLQTALESARKNALAISPAPAHRKKAPFELSNRFLSQQDFLGPGYFELEQLALSDKLAKVVDYEQALVKTSKKIQSARCRYREYLEEKTIVTSDGAFASLKIAQPEIMLSAIAEKNGERTSAANGAGVSGGWQCLYDHPAMDDAVEKTAQLAIDLLAAKYPEGGNHKCILAPSIVGLLCHEAIGHTVEADFVKAGSVAQGKLDTQVASPLVNMADSGQETLAGYAVGNLPFDDEGIQTQTTNIIENGILKSYLHNRQSAHEFGVAPTGNARAWLFDDEPIIRMRNTYFLPGKSRLDDMIKEMDEGYLVEGAGSGQADSNGEFMFGASHVWRIKNGKKVVLLREATLSGLAFDVLKSVDAVSQEFRWDLGTGHCGKGQPAKVDAGGPYIRCMVNVGGRQE